MPQPVPGPTFSVPFRDLGAQVDYDTVFTSDPWVEKRAVAVHYGGGATFDSTWDDSLRTLLAYERYHLGKGWRGLAYSYAVMPAPNSDGVGVVRARGWGINGGHYGNDQVDGINGNREMIAVLFPIGGSEEPTGYAWDQFGKLRAYLEGAMGRTLPLYGHREVAAGGGHSTSCPGSPLMRRILMDRAGVDDEWPHLLRRGDTHPNVRLLRGMLYGLRHLGWTGAVDVKFTVAVERAVRKFQAATGITVDGIVGPETRSRLYDAIGATEGDT